MKLKLYSFLLLSYSSLAFTSCKKWGIPEDRIIGEWKLTEAVKQRYSRTESFFTGYETGRFTFFENGTVVYKDPTDSLNGNWNMRTENDSYYDANGNWQTRTSTTLSMRLYNFSSNRMIDWTFDNFNFESSGNKLVAYMNSASYIYKYYFRRQ